MTCMNYNNIFKILSLIFIISILNGCDSHLLLNPRGEIAVEEYSLILISFIMMLFIIVPVIFMTIYFSIKYRSSNINQTYNPNWCDSKKIEIVVWAIPILIVSCLAFLAWKYSHKLEPDKPIISHYNPIKIDVIALDWKWLFIYPDYHIATINKIIFPVNRPIIFRITSDSVMNSFFIPSLGSQVYAMPGMITKLNLVANFSGTYKGISSNYSGRGFSIMKFTATSVLKESKFLEWVEKIKKLGTKLDNIRIFNLIAMPDENHHVEYFSNVNQELFHDVVSKYAIKKNRFIKKDNTKKILVHDAKVEK